MTRRVTETEGQNLAAVLGTTLERLIEHDLIDIFDPPSVDKAAKEYMSKEYGNEWRTKHFRTAWKRDLKDAILRVEANGLG